MIGGERGGFTQSLDDPKSKSEVSWRNLPQAGSISFCLSFYLPFGFQTCQPPHHVNQFLKIFLLIHSIDCVSVDSPALLGPEEQERLQSHFRFLGLLEDGGRGWGRGGGVVNVFSNHHQRAAETPPMRNSHVVGRVGCDLRKCSRGSTYLHAGWEKELGVREKGQWVIYEL